jgi:membrane protease YdiL (CAAX protease family)
VHYGPQYGYGYAFPHPPPPEHPERPDGVSGFPRWPAWYGPAAFGAGLVVAAIIATIAAAASGGSGKLGTTAALVLTGVLDAIFVGIAILFASMTERPRPGHFGLRRAPFWRTVGWSALGMASFWIVSGTYSVLVKDHGKQKVLEDLHARNSELTIVAVAVLVILVAPAAEEFFFRGFFYRALRTRLGVLAAALVDGALFGGVHYEGPKSALLLPVLAVLGFMFCLIYEKTGTLFATIGLHALNNTIAYGVATRDWVAAGSVGATMLAICTITPVLLGAHSGARPGRAARAPARA